MYLFDNDFGEKAPNLLKDYEVCINYRLIKKILDSYLLSRRFFFTFRRKN